jgi:hypothetical protein
VEIVTIKETFYSFLPTNMIKDIAANDHRLSHLPFIVLLYVDCP